MRYTRRQFVLMMTLSDTGATINVVPWVYGPEILPLEARTRGTAISVSAHWLWNFFIVMISKCSMTPTPPTHPPHIHSNDRLQLPSSSTASTGEPTLSSQSPTHPSFRSYTCFTLRQVTSVWKTLTKSSFRTECKTMLRETRLMGLEKRSRGARVKVMLRIRWRKRFEGRHSYE